MKGYHEVDGKFLFEDYDSSGNYYSITVQFVGTIEYCYTSKYENAEYSVKDYNYFLTDITRQDKSCNEAELDDEEVPAEIKNKISKEVYNNISRGDYYNDWDLSILEDKEDV